MISAFHVSDSDFTDDSESSESNEDANAKPKCKRTLLAHRRLVLRYSSDPLELPSQAFRDNFGMTRELFLTILEKIEKQIRARDVCGITTKEKLAASLRYLIEGSHQEKGPGYNVAVAQPTFSILFTQTLQAIEDILCPQWISMDFDAEEEQKARLFYWEKCGIPGIVLSAGCTHVKILRPKNDKHLYSNKTMGFSSLNVLLICDHKHQIRHVNAKFGGASSDAEVWTASGLDDVFQDKNSDEKAYFKVLADSNFPSKSWLVQPKLEAPPNAKNAEYNKRHAQGREIFNQTISLLKNRFKCLQGCRPLYYTPAKCAQIINVCCTLHNISNQEQSNFPRETINQ